MNLAAISSLSGLSMTTGANNVSTLTGSLKTDGARKTDEARKTDGTMFDAFLNTAIDNIKTTNSYLSDMENEEIKFALGETENTHDLMIAIEKASTALQYTVAIRDKMMDAYKELMQMQI